jgi:hypothetical protein
LEDVPCANCSALPPLPTSPLPEDLPEVSELPEFDDRLPQFYKQSTFGSNGTTPGGKERSKDVVFLMFRRKGFVIWLIIC